MVRQPIRAFDYLPKHRRIETAVLGAIRRVLDSGSLILGPEVCSFEQEFAHYAGAEAGIGVNSGTDALTLALQALGVGPGDEVITVANCGVPPVAAIGACGATPRFVDTNAEDHLIDPANLERALSPRTKCILVVHLYGLAAEMNEILDFARQHDLKVVEDCAQAHGSTYRGWHVGCFGDIGCFSFYPTKNLGAYGDGGICVTNDPNLEKRIRMLRFYGFDDERVAVMPGINSRLDELQAAVLRVKLKYLRDDLHERRTIARRYLDGLRGSDLQLPVPMKDREHSYHLFVIATPKRPRIMAALESDGIGYGLHYPVPVHFMEAYQSLGYGPGDLPNTEQAAHSVLSLPLYPGLEAERVDRVISALTSVG